MCKNAEAVRTRSSCERHPDTSTPGHEPLSARGVGALIATLLLAAMAVASCGGDQPSATSPGAHPSTPTPRVAEPAGEAIETSEPTPGGSVNGAVQPSLTEQSISREFTFTEGDWDCFVEVSRNLTPEGQRGGITIYLDSEKLVDEVTSGGRWEWRFQFGPGEAPGPSTFRIEYSSYESMEWGCGPAAPTDFEERCTQTGYLVGTVTDEECHRIRTEALTLCREIEAAGLDPGVMESYRRFLADQTHRDVSDAFTMGYIWCAP